MIERLAERRGLEIQSLPLWSRFPREKLLDRKGANERAYRRGFELDAYSDDERFFPSFESCVEVGVDWRSLPWTEWEFVVGVDLASTKRPGTFIVPVAVTPENRCLILEGLPRCGSWSTKQLADELDKVDHELSPVSIVVESNGVQDAIVEGFKQEQDRFSWASRVEGKNTGRADKVDREVGLPSMEVEFANHAWSILYAKRHPIDCVCATCVLVDQFKVYPHGDLTDGVMATSFARWKITTLGGQLLPDLPSIDDVKRVADEEREAFAAALKELQ